MKYVQGGIDGGQIKLALEPEAASIWCQHEGIDKKNDFNKTGNKYMTVDLGGTFGYVLSSTFRLLDDVFCIRSCASQWSGNFYYYW